MTEFHYYIICTIILLLVSAPREPEPEPENKNPATTVYNEVTAKIGCFEKSFAQFCLVIT